MKLKENDDAPDFTIPDSHGEKISLHGYLGKWVVLYFYPKDLTPGCTTEAMEFTKMAPEYKKHRAVIIGISKDTCESHLRFMERKKLGITLLSDSDTAVNRLYGVWSQKKFMGREFMGTVRSSDISALLDLLCSLASH